MSRVHFLTCWNLGSKQDNRTEAQSGKRERKKKLLTRLRSGSRNISSISRRTARFSSSQQHAHWLSVSPTAHPVSRVPTREQNGLDVKLTIRFHQVKNVWRQWRTHEFCSRGGFNKFSWGQRERVSGGGSPLVRGSGGSCNLVHKFHFI